jgi:hypothetical protein
MATAIGRSADESTGIGVCLFGKEGQAGSAAGRILKHLPGIHNAARQMLYVDCDKAHRNKDLNSHRGTPLRCERLQVQSLEGNAA